MVFINAKDDTEFSFHFQIICLSVFFFSSLETNKVKYNLSCNYGKKERKAEKKNTHTPQRQNKRHKEWKCTGTGHHQWLSNEVVVAMETRLYETLLKKRPCPVPVWCVCVPACVFRRTSAASLHPQTGLGWILPFLRGVGYGAADFPGSTRRWHSIGVYMFNYSPSPDLGFLTSLIWPAK